MINKTNQADRENLEIRKPTPFQARNVIAPNLLLARNYIGKPSFHYISDMFRLTGVSEIDVVIGDKHKMHEYPQDIYQLIVEASKRPKVKLNMVISNG